MPKHVERRILPFTPDQLYNLVSDIKKYPDFLPWCISCRINKEEGGVQYADMAVGYKIFRETLSCKVKSDPEARSIEVDYISGPMKYLENLWLFNPVEGEESCCEVVFELNYAFKSTILQTVMDSFFDLAFRRMVRAFEERAEDVY